MEIINALRIEPGKPPYLILIENTIDCIRGILGSDIVAVQPWDDNMVALYSRSARLQGERPNRVLLKNSKSPYPIDYVYGSLLLCNADSKIAKGQKSNFCGLGLEQAIKYRFQFGIPDQVITDPSGDVHWNACFQEMNGLFESEE